MPSMRFTQPRCAQAGVTTADPVCGPSMIRITAPPSSSIRMDTELKPITDPARDAGGSKSPVAFDPSPRLGFARRAHYGLSDVWPRPSLFRRQRDRARLLDPAASADAELPAELERGAD